MYVYVLGFFNPRCFPLVLGVVMAPNTPTRIESPQDLASKPALTQYELYLEDQFFEEQARVTAAAIAKSGLQWVDLPPTLHPVPDRPPCGDEVLRVEGIVSPDKRLKLVYMVAGCEFSEWQLESFVNRDGSLLSVAPHTVNRYMDEGPLGKGLFGPVSADFVCVVNKSVAGQNWHEVCVSDVETYVSDWVEARPSVTVFCLGFWDVVVGHVVWRPEDVRPGVYGNYVLEHLEKFISCARRYCFANRVDFDAWMVDHTFLLLHIPSWATLSEEMVTSYTVSVDTWRAIRSVCFRDMYAMETLLWAKYNAILFCPWLPLNLLGGEGVFYRLGRRYSRLYVAQVLAVIAKIVCVRPACKLPHCSKAMKALLNGRPCGDPLREEVLSKLTPCGRLFAWYMPQSVSFRHMYQSGHT